MEFFIALIIFGLSVAVYKDALAKKIARPARWGIGVACIFIIVLPLYLFRRKKIAGSSVEESKGDVSEVLKDRDLNPIAAYMLMFVLSFIAPFLGFMKGDLPACNAPEVAEVIDDLLDGQQFSDAAQVSYDKVAEIRHCNLTTSERVFSYTIKWYSEAKDQFVVKFED